MPRKLTEAAAIETFWGKVSRDGRIHPELGSACWPWNGWRDRNGYGGLRFLRRTVKAHRLAFQLTTGCEPGALYTLHHCDNPPCCNPAHLYLGTAADNVADMHRRGRFRGGAPYGDRNAVRMHPEIVRGEANGRARLKEADVRTIRERIAAGVGNGVLAREYGVTIGMIYHIRDRRSWAHVE